MKAKAFTLIELLIVVAIIAILAAIAVPNFLEAQTRSKVSRTLADMRTFATGAEAYAVDNNKYPKAPSWLYSEEGQRALTTPVSYLTSILTDVFRTESFVYFPQNTQEGGSNTLPSGAVFTDELPLSDWRFAFGYQALNDSLCAICFDTDYGRFKLDPAAPFGGFGPGDLFPFEDGYQLRSPGPDLEDSFNVPYDPTNGTLSIGDVMRWGPTNETLQ